MVATLAKAALSAELTLACQTLLHDATDGRFWEAALQQSQLGECPERAVLADGKPATGILGVAAAPRVGSEPKVPVTALCANVGHQ